MQLTIHIPDNKVDFFMELVNSLGFAKVAHSESSLTQRQKELTDAELRKADETPGYMLDFGTAWKTLNTGG